MCRSNCNQEHSLVSQQSIYAFSAIKISRRGPPLSPIASTSTADGDMREGLLYGSSQAMECSPSGDQAGAFPGILPKKAKDPSLQAGF